MVKKNVKYRLGNGCYVTILFDQSWIESEEVQARIKSDRINICHSIFNKHYLKYNFILKLNNEISRLLSFLICLFSLVIFFNFNDVVIKLALAVLNTQKFSG